MFNSVSGLHFVNKLNSCYTANSKLTIDTQQIWDYGRLLNAMAYMKSVPSLVQVSTCPILTKKVSCCIIYYT